MNTAFLDLLGRLTFRMTRAEALAASVCIRCKAEIDPAALSEVDSREYLISAFCPECFQIIMPADER